MKVYLNLYGIGLEYNSNAVALDAVVHLTWLKQTLIQESKYCVDMGTIATRLIRGYAAMSLVPVGTNGQEDYSFFPSISTDALKTVKLKVYQKNELVYDGSLANFSPEKVVNKFEAKDVKAGQVIRFTYDGGSNPGAVRVVEVKEVDYGLFKTRDLVSGELRSFSTSRIKNLEKVK